MENISVNKILVFRLSSIGDIILTTPLLRCLRKKFPNAQIDFVIKKQFQVLMNESPYIDKLWMVDKATGFAGLRDLTKQLRAEHYDVFIDIHKNFRSLYVRTFSFPKHKYSYRKNVWKRTALVKFKLDLYKKYEPVYLRYIEAVKSLGVEYDGEGTELYVPSNSQNAVDCRLSQNGISLQDKIFVMCPGASFTNKQWLPERFAELGKMLLAKYPDSTVIFHGGQREAEMCVELQKQCGGKSFNYAGKLNLLESAALTNRACVVIANDTGMMHIAESQRVPVVGIYGPTARQFGFYPILKQSRAMAVDLPCRPCTKMGMNRCPKTHFNCMKNISVKMVFDAVTNIVDVK